MKKTILFVSMLSLALGNPHFGVAQDRGPWYASSSDAKSITGDIIIGDGRITISLLVFPLAHIRTLKSEEVAAAFDADLNAGVPGNLFRLNIPAAQRFLHHNTLCGSESAQWMATYVEGKTLHVTFFSGVAMPVFTFDALSHSSDVCGTFTYTR
jgi:hypothetical protein